LYHNRAGHGAAISPQTQWGYTVFARTKIFRIIGDSGIHVGAMSFDKTEGDALGKGILFMLQQDGANGPYLFRNPEGKKQTTPIISGGMSAWGVQAFFENLGRSNVIPTAGGDTLGHRDGLKQGATSCRQGEVSWKMWKAGAYDNVSLSDGVVAYARTHEEITGAFLKFQKVADKIYPGWKEQISYTGGPSALTARLVGKERPHPPPSRAHRWRHLGRSSSATRANIQRRLPRSIGKRRPHPPLQRAHHRRHLGRAAL
jgi:ribulose-bisphosphate carboxylase large chain